MNSYIFLRISIDMRPLNMTQYSLQIICYFNITNTIIQTSSKFSITYSIHILRATLLIWHIEYFSERLRDIFSGGHLTNSISVYSGIEVYMLYVRRSRQPCSSDAAFIFPKEKPPSGILINIPSYLHRFRVGLP